MNGSGRKRKEIRGCRSDNGYGRGRKVWKSEGSEREEARNKSLQRWHSASSRADILYLAVDNQSAGFYLDPDTISPPLFPTQRCSLLRRSNLPCDDYRVVALFSFSTLKLTATMRIILGDSARNADWKKKVATRSSIHFFTISYSFFILDVCVLDRFRDDWLAFGCKTFKWTCVS